MRMTDSTSHCCLQHLRPRVSAHLLTVLLLVAATSAVAAAANPSLHHGGTFSTSPWQAQIESLAAVEDELRPPVTASHADSPAICVIVRTFWGHGGRTAEHQRQGLRSLLASLQAQRNSR